MEDNLMPYWAYYEATEILGYTREELQKKFNISKNI